MTKQLSNGFTLLELMITVTILGILSAIAYPSFESSIQDNRLTSQTNRLLAAFQFARSEAAANNTTITVCSSGNGQTCDGNNGNWSNGFIVLEGATVLQEFDGLEGNNTVRGSAQISFNNRGTLANSIQLSLCDRRGNDAARGIWINGAGQARVGGTPQCI